MKKEEFDALAANEDLKDVLTLQKRDSLNEEKLSFGTLLFIAGRAEQMIATVEEMLEARTIDQLNHVLTKANNVMFGLNGHANELCKEIEKKLVTMMMESMIKKDPKLDWEEHKKNVRLKLGLKPEV